MDQASILPRPAEPRCRGQSALDHRPSVHIPPCLKAPKLLAQPLLQRREPLLEHFVIIAGPPRSVGIGAAAPRVARNPPRALCGRLGRARLVAVVAGKANHHRARPRKRNPHPRPRQLIFSAPPRFGARQVVHGPRVARAHPFLKPRRIPPFICMRKRHQTSLVKPGLKRQPAHPFHIQQCGRARRHRLAARLATLAKLSQSHRHCPAGLTLTAGHETDYLKPRGFVLFRHLFHRPPLHLFNLSPQAMKIPPLPGRNSIPLYHIAVHSSHFEDTLDRLACINWPRRLKIPF